MPFAKGESGNPNGRPKGTKNTTALINQGAFLEKLGTDEAGASNLDNTIQTTLKLALGYTDEKGKYYPPDIRACKLIIDKFIADQRSVEVSVDDDLKQVLPVLLKFPDNGLTNQPDGTD